MLELVLDEELLLLEPVFRLLEDSCDDDDDDVVVDDFVVTAPSPSFSEFESDRWFSADTGL